MRSKARLDRWTLRVCVCVCVCVCVQTTTWLGSRVYREHWGSRVYWEHWGSGVGGGKREKEKRNTATTFCTSTVVSHCICTAQYSDENSLVPGFNTSQLVGYDGRRLTLSIHFLKELPTHNPPALTVVLWCDWLQQLFINFRTGLTGFAFSSPDTCPEVTLCRYWWDVKHPWW